MNITLTGNKIKQDTKTLAFEKNNNVDVINITVDTDESWTYKLDVKYLNCRDNKYNIINLERTGDTLTAVLTAEMLPFAGKYLCQLRGINGDKVYHTDTFEVWVKYSIEPGETYNPIPSEFYQIEENITEINNHPPYPGDNGKWMIYDVNKQQYVESDVEVIGDGDGVLVVTVTPDSNGEIAADATFDEIWDYINNSKGSVVLKVINSNSYNYALATTASNQMIKFTFLAIEKNVNNNDIIYGDTYICNKSNQWKISQNTINIGNFEKISNKTTTLTDKSTDIQYPSAKATYNAIQEVAKTAGKIDSIEVNGVSQEIDDKTVKIIINKNTVGLNNVDNTSDLNKPISNATKTALDAKLSIQQNVDDVHKILEINEDGVVALANSKTFVAKLSQDINYNYVCDKTFEEFEQAWENGCSMFAVDSATNRQYSLLTYSNSTFIFGQTSEGWEDWIGFIVSQESGNMQIYSTYMSLYDMLDSAYISYTYNQSLSDDYKAIARDNIGASAVIQKYTNPTDAQLINAIIALYNSTDNCIIWEQQITELNNFQTFIFRPYEQQSIAYGSIWNGIAVGIVEIDNVLQKGAFQYNVKSDRYGSTILFIKMYQPYYVKITEKNGTFSSDTDYVNTLYQYQISPYIFAIYNNKNFPLESYDETNNVFTFSKVADGKLTTITISKNGSNTTVDVKDSGMIMPVVSESDNGKILKVINGEWAVVDSEA